jgi:acyl carrier protein
MTPPPPQPADSSSPRSVQAPGTTIERVKTVLRRDLKLGPDVTIADDMPLAGGDFDLDSLDMLLLLTSIEKEFGVRITDGSVGREVFASVATLGAFIESMQPRS